MTPELVLIGSVIADPPLLDKALEAGVKPEHFTDRTRASLWKAICFQRSAGRGFDLVALSVEMGDKCPFEAYMEAERSAPTSLNFGASLDAVLWDFKHRQIIKKAEAILHATEKDDVLAGVSMLAEVANATQDFGFADLDAAGSLVEQEMQDAIDGKEDQRVHYPMPLPCFDNILGRIYDNELIVVAARPSVGKTSWVLQMLTECVKAGLRVAFIPTEMEARDVIRQIASQVSGVNLLNIRQEFPEKLRKAKETAAKIRSSKHVRIFDKSTSLPAIEACCRSVKGWADIVFIDQLAQIRNPGGSRYESLTDTCYTAVAIKKMLGKPLLLAHQLKRAPIGENHVPSLNDLKDSGAVEEVASRVLLLHCPDEKFDGTLQRGLNIDPPETRDMWVIQAKHRFGVRDLSMRCRYHAPTTKFISVS